MNKTKQNYLYFFKNMQLRIARGAELVSVGGKTRMPFKPQINRMKVQKSTRVRSRARAHKWRPTRTRDVTVIVQRRRGGPGMTTRESVTAGKKKKTDGIGRDEHFAIHSLSIDWLLLLIVSFYLFFFLLAVLSFSALRVFVSCVSTIFRHS